MTLKSYVVPIIWKEKQHKNHKITYNIGGRLGVIILKLIYHIGGPKSKVVLRTQTTSCSATDPRTFCSTFILWFIIDREPGKGIRTRCKINTSKYILLEPSLFLLIVQPLRLRWRQGLLIFFRQKPAVLLALSWYTKMPDWRFSLKRTVIKFQHQPTRRQCS